MADPKITPERPPELAEKILARLLPDADRGPILGDMAEEYAQRADEHGSLTANRWYWRQLAISAVPALLRRMSRPSFAFSWIDIKLGIRMLGKQPILSAVAGLTLALGIPAALIPTHMIGVMEADLPVDEGDRVLGLRNWDIEANDPGPASLLHDFAVWRETLGSFEALGAARFDPWNVHSPDGRAADVRGAEVTASVFSILRVPPLLGRALLPSDEVEGAPDVVVISSDLWASRFASDPAIVGKTIGIGRRPHTVVGVMPDGFNFPIDDHLWLPLRADPSDYVVGGGPDLIVIGRLADGVSAAEASAELEAVGARLSFEWPETHAALRPQAQSYSVMLVGEVDGWEIILVQLISFALLAVACGNVGTLILARTATRMNEISVRTALGASRIRILSQLFAESLVLALAATAVGLVLAQIVVNGLADGLVDGELPYWVDLDLTPRIILIAFGLGSGCAVVAGVLPAIKATSPRIQRNLQAHARGTTVRFGAFTTGLIVAEVALSVAFLCFGAAAFESFMTHRAGDAGMDPDRYLIARLRTPWVEPAAAESNIHETVFQVRATANQDELVARLAADRDVRHVAMGATLPGTGHATRWAILDGAGEETAIAVQGARVHVDYFGDLEIDVVQGRAFTSADVEGLDRYERLSVVVNDQFVQNVLGGSDAVGRLIRFTDPNPGEPPVAYEIVGVVETFGTNLLNPDDGAAVYHPLSSADIHPMPFIVEVDGDAAAFVPRLRSIAASIDPDAIVENPTPVAELVAQSRLEMRTITFFVLSLSAVGMLLAATGLYALMSFTVSQRTREIGIRTALGADAKDVVTAIARRAGAQLIVGVALGSVAGWQFVRSNAGIFGVDSEARLVGGVAVAVTVFSALTCLQPVRRGLRIQPTEALREA